MIFKKFFQNLFLLLDFLAELKFILDYLIDKNAYILS